MNEQQISIWYLTPQSLPGRFRKTAAHCSYIYKYKIHLSVNKRQLWYILSVTESMLQWNPSSSFKCFLIGVQAHLLSLTDNACTVAGQGITEHVGSGAFRMWVDRSGVPSLTDTFTCILTWHYKMGTSQDQTRRVCASFTKKDRDFCSRSLSLFVWL